MDIMIHKYREHKPKVAISVFIANNALIIGDVEIDEDSSVWIHTVIRGDVAPTKIGKRVNIQDLSLIHQSPGLPVLVDHDVTVGHHVTIHAAALPRSAL